jgi:hypothetical protein
VLYRGTGQPVRCSDVIILVTEKVATALMTVAIVGVGPACVALLLLL